jgi:hypothetical protein
MLSGIREYVGKNLIKTLAIDDLKEHGGKLSILFENGASFETNFASYQVLKNFVYHWRNVHGSTLVLNGVVCGIVCRDNPFLKYDDENHLVNVLKGLGISQEQIDKARNV